MTDDQAVEISERALIGRINRKLAAEDEAVKTTRGGRAEQDFGRHYVIDLRSDVVVAQGVNLEEWGRELGVLRPHEAVAE